jgi:D-glycero-alpha-D-manno-heptose-7-phosphate kinase
MDTLARTAIYLERDVLYESVGFQDQIFASYGGFNHVKFYGAKRYEIERININENLTSELSESLVMFYTGRTRRASDIEENKLKKIDSNIKTLDRMRECVDDALKILSSGKPFDEIGSLLDESWQLKRTLSREVSNGYIDELYELGMKNGALGGKLLGAGGGGFLLFYVPRRSMEKFKNALSHLHEVNFSLNAQGSSIIHAGA